MRICFDVSPSVHRHAGLGRYAAELLAALMRVDHANEYRAFYNSQDARKLPPAPIDQLPRARVPLDAKPWRLSALIAQLLNLGMDRALPACDLFHATDHLLPRLKRARTIFTLHDLIFQFYPQYHLPLNRWFLAFAMPRFLHRADAIIAVSEWTKQDAIKLYHLPPEKIFVIHEGVNSALKPEIDQKKIAHARARYAKNRKFIFFLATIEPRKNLIRLIDAVRALNLRGLNQHLLVAGRKGWLYQDIFAHVKKVGMQDRVDFLDYVPDEDLPALMAACDAFVFPSLYEGFGLPPLEAMACGAPVIASNASALPEILGDAALYVNPTNTADIAIGIERVLSNRELRDELRAKGIAHARKYSWERAARETLAVYEQVASRKSHLKSERET